MRQAAGAAPVAGASCAGGAAAHRAQRPSTSTTAWAAAKPDRAAARESARATDASRSSSAVPQPRQIRNWWACACAPPPRATAEQTAKAPRRSTLCTKPCATKKPRAR